MEIPELVRATAAELKLVRSVSDVRRLARKMPFVIPRLSLAARRDASLPITLQLEPTNVCNASCACCPRARSRRKTGFMDLALFRNTLNQAARLGIPRVHLYLHGEPLLHPSVLEMVAAVKTAGLSVNLVTNGQLLDQAMSNGLLRCGLDISDYLVISVLGGSKAVHESVMRGVNHDNVVGNAARFMALRRDLKRNGPIVQSIFYTLRENRQETELYRMKWRRIVDYAFCIPAVSESFASIGRPATPLPLRSVTCRNLWERMTVYWNGDVTLCCEDIHGSCVVGNLNSTPLEELWKSDGLTRVRAAHRERRFQDVPLCATCDMGRWDS